MTRKKPKTPFGIELAQFAATHGKTIKEIAEASGVKYSTLVEVTTGRTAGHRVVPVVRDYMRTLEETK